MRGLFLNRDHQPGARERACKSRIKILKGASKRELKLNARRRISGRLMDVVGSGTVRVPGGATIPPSTAAGGHLAQAGIGANQALGRRN
jgi:hypothetical protein